MSVKSDPPTLEFDADDAIVASSSGRSFTPDNSTLYSQPAQLPPVSNSVIFEDLTMADIAVIINIPGNDKCADCSASRPEWASLGFGVLVCLDCAGFHRSLGVHITLVRSLKMDSWSSIQKNKLFNGGNKKFTDYVESRRRLSTSSTNTRKMEILTMHMKYQEPRILYYKEIFLSEIENREPCIYEESMWINIASSSGSVNKNGNNNNCQSPEWMPDSDTLECTLCGVPFSLFRRRHHCRRYVTICV